MTKTTHDFDEFDREMHNMINRQDYINKPFPGCSRRSLIAFGFGMGTLASLGILGYQFNKSDSREQARSRIEREIEKYLLGDGYKVNAADILPDHPRVPLVRVELSKDSNKGVLYVYQDKETIAYSNNSHKPPALATKPADTKAFCDAFGKPKDLADKVRKIVEENK